MPGNPQMRTFSQTTLTIRTDGRTDKQTDGQTDGRTDGQKSPNDCSNPPPIRFATRVNESCIDGEISVCESVCVGGGGGGRRQPPALKKAKQTIQQFV